jgi:hypothetical protein
LICSAALVIIVPFICTTKVMKHASSVTLHFFETGQLNGLSGSVGPVQSMVFCFDREGNSSVLGSCSSLGSWFSPPASCVQASEATEREERRSVVESVIFWPLASGREQDRGRRGAVDPQTSKWQRARPRNCGDYGYTPSGSWSGVGESFAIPSFVKQCTLKRGRYCRL